MSFDTIQLPSSVIADLYKQSLVVLNDVQLNTQRLAKKNNLPLTEEIPVVENAKQPVDDKKNMPVEQIPDLKMTVPTIRFMGGFKQEVSVVIADPSHEQIGEEDLDFLKKMMDACKLTIDDMAIINVVSNQPAAQQLWQLMRAKVVLMFDVSTSSVGIPFYQPDFKVQHWDSAQFMNAPALSAFRGPETPELKALKRALWESLQKIFLKK